MGHGDLFREGVLGQKDCVGPGPYAGVEQAADTELVERVTVGEGDDRLAVVLASRDG